MFMREGKKLKTITMKEYNDWRRLKSEKEREKVILLERKELRGETFDCIEINVQCRYE